tara:strand:- start:5164 stop:5679 length:516 start_codon:yes stop_codon:yes gene_type:complete
MLKRYYTLWVFLAGLIGFSVGVALKTTWEESKFIIGQWKDDPIIVVCPDSQVSKYRVYKAVEWWGIRGYEVAYIHFDNDGILCSKGRWSKGIIFIRADGDLLPHTYAITSRLTILDEMISASITLPNEQKHKPRLLEHELGHAFGMRHAEELGHMMHPIWEHGGELFWIPD